MKNQTARFAKQAMSINLLPKFDVVNKKPNIGSHFITPKWKVNSICCPVALFRN